MKAKYTAANTKYLKYDTIPCNATGIASFCIFDGDFHFNCSQASHNTSTIPLERK
jgi:hypothetical protein